MPLMWLLTLHASAAEVVWITPPTPEVRSEILAQAEVVGDGVSLEDVPGSAAAWSEEDALRLAAVAAALRDVRPYEQKLDGELLIFRDLEPALAAVRVIRDEADRAQVHAALAYQGFATARYFQTDLATAPGAAEQRSEVGPHVVPRAWRDAIALEPDRAITAYEISEAPERLAYEDARTRLSETLEATVGLGRLPAGVTVRIDGRATPVGASGMVRLRPGRHWIHLEHDGRIVAAWTGEVDAGARVDPALRTDDTALRAWVARLSAGGSEAPPAEVARDLRALDDRVWLVDPSAKDVRAWIVSDAGVHPRSLSAEPERAAAPSRRIRPTASVGAGPGWTSTADYYRQDPASFDATFATVNAPGVTGTASIGVDVGRLRVEAGCDLTWTPGEAHVARWQDHATHLRAFPHLAVGLPEIRVAAGWLTPHHLGAGPRLAVPLGPVEFVANGTVGVSPIPAPAEGTWSAAPVWSAWGGLVLRAGGKGDDG